MSNFFNPFGSGGSGSGGGGGVGLPGKDGVSIENIEINSNYELVCYLSDGSTIITDPILMKVEDIAYTTSTNSSIKNVKNALDNLFENSGTIGEEFKPSLKPGSVKDKYSANTPLKDIIKDMLTEKIPPTLTLTLNPSTLIYDEVSDSINSLTINATVAKKTNPIKKIEYFINNVSVKVNETGVSSGGTFPYIYNTLINDDTVIKVVVSDDVGLSTTATKTITFIGNSYYGLIDADSGEPSAALVKTLNKNLKTTKKFVYSGITTNWAKVCYAYPAELGKLTSIMDKVNNFNYTSSFQLTTKEIDGISYYIYTLIDPTGADNVELTFE